MRKIFDNINYSTCDIDALAMAAARKIYGPMDADLLKEKVDELFKTGVEIAYAQAYGTSGTKHLKISEVLGDQSPCAQNLRKLFIGYASGMSRPANAGQEKGLDFSSPPPGSHLN